MYAVHVLGRIDEAIRQSYEDIPGLRIPLDVHCGDHSSLTVCLTGLGGPGSVSFAAQRVVAADKQL